MMTRNENSILANKYFLKIVLIFLFFVLSIIVLYGYKDNFVFLSIYAALALIIYFSRNGFDKGLITLLMVQLIVLGIVYSILALIDLLAGYRIQEVFLFKQERHWSIWIVSFVKVVINFICYVTTSFILLKSIKIGEILKLPVKFNVKKGILLFKIIFEECEAIMNDNKEYYFHLVAKVHKKDDNRILRIKNFRERYYLNLALLLTIAKVVDAKSKVYGELLDNREKHLHI